MKNTYIKPAVCIVTVSTENMIALSGPGYSSDSALQNYGMDAKAQTHSNYNVWNDDWSAE